MASLSKVSWLLIFTIFALPLMFFPWAYLAFELPKIFLLYLFSVSAVYLLLSSGYKIANLTKVHWLFLVFFTWIILTAILGLSLQQSFWGSYFRMQGLLTWIGYGVLFFISAKITAEVHFRRYLSLAILISSTLSAVFALTQFILLWFFGYTSQLLYSGRVIATFGQPNFLGAFLVMSLPFIWYLVKISSKANKIVYILSLITVILGIFSTFSRSAYLGLLILSLIWGFYHYRLLLTAIASSIILFAVLANLLPNLVYSEWYRFKVDTISKWTAENRLLITQKSIQLIQQKPILGYGIENFSLAFPAIIIGKDIGLKDIVVDSSHNLFLDLAVQTGLVGLGLFLIFLAVTFIQGLKHDAFVKAALLSTIAFVVIHQFSPYSAVPMSLFWLCLGALNKPTLIQTNLHKISKYLINIFGLGLIAITLFYIVQTLRAEIPFRYSSAYEVIDIQRAIKLDNDAIKLAPWVEFYNTRRNFLLRQLGYNF